MPRARIQEADSRKIAETDCSGGLLKVVYLTGFQA